MLVFGSGESLLISILCQNKAVKAGAGEIENYFNFTKSDLSLAESN